MKGHNLLSCAQESGVQGHRDKDLLACSLYSYFLRSGSVMRLGLVTTGKNWKNILKGHSYLLVWREVTRARSVEMQIKHKHSRSLAGDENCVALCRCYLKPRA